MRDLQDRFDSRRLADRMEKHILRTAFTDEDQAFIGSRALFFLSTADSEGWPDCSYKGGLPGFVRVVGPDTLAFPSYDGNGMYRSLGNLRVNPKVGLLFIDFDTPKRLRVNGTASLDERDPLLAGFPGAELLVRVRAVQIFPNCPRYIHRMQVLEQSAFAPRANYTPPEPGWKQREEFRDALPAPHNP
jgi:hypothetical protein